MNVAVLLGESPYSVGEGIVLDDVRRDIEHRCLVNGRAEGCVEQRRVFRDVRGIHWGKQAADCLGGFVEGEGLGGVGVEPGRRAAGLAQLRHDV